MRASLFLGFFFRVYMHVCVYGYVVSVDKYVICIYFLYMRVRKVR